MVTARCPGATRDLAIGHRNVALKSSASGSARITEFPAAPWYFTRKKINQTDTEADESMLRNLLINTPLQRGDLTGPKLRNRFSGFPTLNSQPSTKPCLKQFD